MFEQRSAATELMDDLSIAGAELKKNLDEIEFCNRVFGSHRALTNALNRVYKINFAYLKNRKLVIADLGCGGGDQIMLMDQWAKSKNLKVDFIGIDANPFMIEYANNKSHTAENIEYKSLSIHSAEFAEMQFDIITLNNVTHHFKDHELIALFTKLPNQVRLAIIINDLHRHWLSYYFIKLVTKVLRFSYLTKADAPVSVLRAFRKRELISLLKQAQLNSYQIFWAWAFRWVVIIRNGVALVDKS